MRYLTSFILLLLTTAPVFAVDPNVLPEPDALSLLGIGAMAGFAVYLTNKRKR